MVGTIIKRANPMDAKMMIFLVCIFPSSRVAVNNAFQFFMNAMTYRPLN
ncbi:exported hypothetical protein [Syntrophobacter sp. SbD2]|nr:exported hypothetical protein [Syntrophobacter sp. SbD2]